MLFRLCISLGVLTLALSLAGVAQSGGNTPSSVPASAVPAAAPGAFVQSSAKIPIAPPKSLPAPVAASTADPTAGAPSNASASSNVPRIVKNVNEVNVIFSATDKHHHFVRGLNANDLVVYDQHRLQRITRFSDNANLPLRVALLIDVSTSVNDRFRFEQEAAIEFFDSVIRPGVDKGMLVSFDSSPEVVQDFTDDVEALANSIRALRAAGGTALFDAVYATAHDRFLKMPDEGTRKVMVIITDGADDASRVSRDEAIEEAQRAGVTIYTIGTEPTGSDPDDDRVLDLMADQTGGRVFFPFQAADLSRSFQNIVTELRHQYILTYNPNNFIANGAFHPIDIRAEKKHIIIHARRGYYAFSQP
jgi:Ca-activated chloride channel family protein